MPIAYLYRHSLELELKHLVRLGLAACLIKNTSDIQDALKQHNLHNLWCQARTAIEKRWPEGKKDVLNNTQSLIQDFQRIDRSGQNLRYTRDRQNKPTVNKYPKSIELIEFQLAFEGVHNLLEGCAAGFGDVIDYIADAKRET